ncbi:MAG: ECF transporter S component [Candidatus Brockarchaeota archaeon]|nr:ECF transporter S component [Candidatus Brockarchaeota archaeon]
MPSRTPGISRSRKVAATALCAALYGATGYMTSFIQSPWGFGQFRPAAAVVPVIFAVLFGPWVAGVGAALGSQITDTLTPGYFLSGIIAGMPGNFLGFYLYGWLLRGRFSWRRFVLTSAFTLFAANLVTAALVAVYYAIFLPSVFNLAWGAALTVGLTAYWFITMLPFALTIDPALIRIVSRSKPELAPEDVLRAAIKDETKEVAFALIVTGSAVLAIGLAFFTKPEVVQLAGVPAYPLQILFGGGGAAMLALGFVFLLYGRLAQKPSSAREAKPEGGR